MTHQTETFEFVWDSRTVALEYQLIAGQRPDAPLIVFLHEGLGSLSLWKDFPGRLCSATGCRGLVYSRPGYGQSTPLDQSSFWGTDFMHRQAYEVLPELLAGLDVHPGQNRIWLFGHSDGASISLLYSAAYPEHVDGLVAVAPHIFVEDITIKSITQLVENYLPSGLNRKLATHHRDPDATFYGWSHVWLAQTFRDWSIESELQKINTPVCVIQGTDDEYGSQKQVLGINKQVKNLETHWITGCGHAPHRTHSQELLDYSITFIQQNCKRQSL